MTLNYKEILDKKLSINSYLWPNELDPYEFIKSIVKSQINNVGLHTGFIEKFGINRLKQELILNKINITSLNSIGYFTDPKYFNENDKILSYAKILKPEYVCVISGGIKGGPNPLSKLYDCDGSALDIFQIRKESSVKIKKLFEHASNLKIKLGLEPIGSWEILKKGHFNSISSCLKFLKDNDHKLIIDLYHSFSDINLDLFLKNSKKLGLLQFSNIKFDKNFRPCGRKDINGIIKENDLDISRYLKYVFNRNDNTKVEFEIFPSDLNGQDPKKIINNLKSKILNLL